MVHAVYRLALASANVKGEAVEIGEYPRLAQQYRVRAVPMTVLDGRTVVTGAMNETRMVDELIKASESSVASPGSQTTAGEATAAPELQGQQGERPAGGGLILPR